MERESKRKRGDESTTLSSGRARGHKAPTLVAATELMEHLVKEMSSDDTEVVTKAMVEAGEMFRNDMLGVLVETAHRNECPRRLIEAMRRKKDENVQKSGCLCMSALSSTVYQDVVKALSKEGAFDVVTAVMKNFPDSIEVQEACCATLNNLVDKVSLPVEAEVLHFVRDLNGLHYVVRALEVDNAKVVGEALRFLQWMSLYREETKKKIKTEGVVGAICRWIAKATLKWDDDDGESSQDPEALLRACNTLTNLYRTARRTEKSDYYY